MPSTHLSLHFHVVFSTKNREPRIATEWRERLHAYLGGVARKSGTIPEAVGGVSDHVHLLLGLTATARLADVVRDIKPPLRGEFLLLHKVRWLAPPANFCDPSGIRN